MKDPQFIRGGVHGGGLRGDFNDGPEFEFKGPAAASFAEQQPQQLVSPNAELIAEIKLLRAELSGLRESLRQESMRAHVCNAYPMKIGGIG